MYNRSSSWIAQKDLILLFIFVRKINEIWNPLFHFSSPSFLHRIQTNHIQRGWHKNGKDKAYFIVATRSTSFFLFQRLKSFPSARLSHTILLFLAGCVYVCVALWVDEQEKKKWEKPQLGNWKSKYIRHHLALNQYRRKIYLQKGHIPEKKKRWWFNNSIFRQKVKTPKKGAMVI